jgi:hypothetical protein
MFNNLEKKNTTEPLDPKLKVKETKPKKVKVLDKHTEEDRMEAEKELADPTIIEYKENIEGVIASFADRYPFNYKLYQSMMMEWLPHKDDLRVGANVENGYSMAQKSHAFS